MAAAGELALWTTRGDGEVKLRLGDSGLAAEPPQTVHQAFLSAVERFGALPALSWRDGEQRRSLSYREYYQACRTAAKGFLKVFGPGAPGTCSCGGAIVFNSSVSLQLGLQRCHGVGILGFNSAEWFIADIGAILAG